MDIPPPPPPPPPSPDDAPPPGQSPYQSQPQYPPPPNPYAQQQPPLPPQPAEGQQPQQHNPYATAGPYGTPYPGTAQQQPFGYAAPGGQLPYPGQPQGWYAQERTTNGMSIAALVVGLVPCTVVLGLIFGLVGLKQVKRRGERGKGLAVAGITLSSVWTLGLAALITLAALGVFEAGNTAIADLKAGQCFNPVDGPLPSDSDDDSHSSTVDVVDCADQHDAEVFAVWEIQSGSGDPYPGTEKVDADAQAGCQKYAGTYLDGKHPAGIDNFSIYLPSAANWAHHQRSVICFFDPPGKVTGSVKSGGGSTDDSGDSGGSGDSGVGV
ncbi:DUF4190 domain-containing protein [Streptomyces sp. NPDC049040]|uniref:DUF4190 domain-containing protein n=1 Tax=Streptomyces sp. NPDC049040 TaxID=3365593 RepID=UPI00371B2DDD